MRLLCLLLFVGAAVAIVTTQEITLDDFTDDELVDISKREPEVEDDQGIGTEGETDNDNNDDDDDDDDPNDNLGHMCRESEKKKPVVNDKMKRKYYHDDDNDDDESDYKIQKRHHPSSLNPRRHHPRRHHGHQRGKHHRRGRRGVCRRQFCRCKMSARKDCRKIIRCFMRMAYCVRRRRCHRRPHFGPRGMHSLGTAERKRKEVFFQQKRSKQDHHHPKKICIKRFKQCLLNTTRGDCRGKLRCIFELKHCVRSGNRSEPTPTPTPQVSDVLDDFQDQELMEVSEHESLVDEEAHNNYTGRGFCRHEYRRCLNRTGDNCRKKFFCFVRMAHCARCSFRHHHHHHHRAFPTRSTPPGISQRQGYKVQIFGKIPKRFGQFGFQRLIGAFKRLGGKFPGFKKTRHTGVFKRPGGKFPVFKRLGQVGGFKRPRCTRSLWFKRLRPCVEKRPSFRKRIRPGTKQLQNLRKRFSSKCKSEVTECLKRADKDCSKKFKCYFNFLRCLRNDKGRIPRPF